MPKFIKDCQLSCQKSIKVTTLSQSCRYTIQKVMKNSEKLHCNGKVEFSYDLITVFTSTSQLLMTFENNQVIAKSRKVHT